MPIKGSLREASLPDVVQLLALGRKTGCLSVADRGKFGNIYFEDGRIVYASIVNRRDRLGDSLVRDGQLSRDQLEAAIAEQREHRERRLGDVLLGRGWVTRELLGEYMRNQIEEAVYFLFTWTQGTFHFEADVQPERRDFLVSVKAESLVLEGARRIDEWGLIAKKVPSFDMIFVANEERLAAREVSLTPEQERIVGLLDGSRDVQHVVDDARLREFEVGQALYALISAGFVEHAGRSSPVPQPRVTDSRIDEHRNLGVAFYRTGMLDEAAREFRRVSELKPEDPTAQFHVGLVALRQARWKEALRAFGLALERGGQRPAILHNLALTYELTGRLPEAEESYAEAAARAPEDPAILLAWGVLALKRGDAATACERLDLARGDSEQPKAVWYWARTLAAAASDDFGHAEALAREAVDRYPHDPVLRNNAAVLLELGGELTRAESLLSAAVAEAPSVPQLSKNLGDVRYRAGRYDEAWDAYQRAVSLSADLGYDVYFKMGNIAYKRADREAAERSWRRALELNPRHELARANLATLDVLE
jgi:tetratricopeptide (TPR) repeat protein